MGGRRKGEVDASQPFSRLARHAVCARGAEATKRPSHSTARPQRRRSRRQEGRHGTRQAPVLEAWRRPRLSEVDIWAACDQVSVVFLFGRATTCHHLRFSLTHLSISFASAGEQPRLVLGGGDAAGPPRPLPPPGPPQPHTPRALRTTRTPRSPRTPQALPALDHILTADGCILGTCARQVKTPPRG